MAHRSAGNGLAVSIGFGISAFNVLSGLSTLLSLTGQLSELAVIPNEISAMSGLSSSTVAWLFMGMGYLLGVFSILAIQRLAGEEE